MGPCIYSSRRFGTSGKIFLSLSFACNTYLVASKTTALYKSSGCVYIIQNSREAGNYYNETIAALPPQPFYRGARPTETVTRFRNYQERADFLTMFSQITELMEKYAHRFKKPIGAFVFGFELSLSL